MADISMSYSAVSQLEEKAAFLQNGFNDFIRDFDSVTGDIMNSWEGIAKTDFAAKCKAVLPGMKAISALLGQYSTVIGQAVSLQQSTEHASAADAEQLSF